MFDLFYQKVWRFSVNDYKKNLKISKIAAENLKKAVDEKNVKSMLAIQDLPQVGLKSIESIHEFIRSKNYGRNFVHGTGHGFGLEIHEFPSLTYKSKVVAQDSMAVTIEPGIYVPGKGGVRIEDDVLVNGNNPKVLTKAKKDLY